MLQHLETAICAVEMHIELQFMQCGHFLLYDYKCTALSTVQARCYTVLKLRRLECPSTLGSTNASIILNETRVNLDEAARQSKICTCDVVQNEDESYRHVIGYGNIVINNT